MAYVGNQPAKGQFRKLTDISGSFDGVATTFTTSVPPGTSEYYVTAGSASQLLVSLGGVIQQPDVDYTVSTNSITFTTAPAGGLDFFGVLMGDALNAGTPSDGSVTTAKLAGSLSVGLAAGSDSTPSLFFTGDANNGIYSPGTDQLAVTTNGVERVEFGTSEVVFNDGGENYDFRIEGDTNSSLFFVDASADAVGIGTTSPDTALTVLKNSNADFSSQANLRASSLVTFDNSQNTTAIVFKGTSTNPDKFIFSDNQGGTQNFGIGFQNGSTRVNSVNCNQFGVTIFNRIGAESARIDDSGRLLVGTSSSFSSNSALQVASAFAARIYSNGNVGPTTLTASIQTGTGGMLHVSSYQNGVGSSYRVVPFVKDKLGNLQLGTAITTTVRTADPIGTISAVSNNIDIVVTFANTNVSYWIQYIPMF